MKTYELSLAENYVSDWTLQDAIRELWQNALDNPGGFNFSSVQDTVNDSYALRITSKQANLLKETLLLGHSNKADGSIGKFGEGYKLALLVLTRLGHEVRILTGNKQWVPTIKESKTYGVSALHVLETEIHDLDNHDVVFTVYGLTEEQLYSVMGICRATWSDELSGVEIQTPKGSILRDHPGKLYVGGLYVCDTDLRYGYDFTPAELQLDRDRKTVDNWDLKLATSLMWASSTQYGHIAKMLSEGVPDVAMFEYTTNNCVSQACYELYTETNGEYIPVESQEEVQRYAAQGVSSTIVVSSAYNSAIRRCDSYKESATKLKTPMVILQTWYDEHIDSLREKPKRGFKNLIKAAANWSL